MTGVVGNQSVNRALDHLFEAKKALHAVIAREYPPGTEIEFTHGNNIIFATVREVSLDRLFVLGRSGSSYWIYASRVIRKRGAQK